MSSKTFEHGDEVIQIPGIPDNRTVSIFVLDSDNDEAQMTIPATDAPALCLAILEAAGYSEESHGLMEYVVGNLREAVRYEAERTAEAKEQAELKAEALELFNTQVSALGEGLELQSLNDMHALAKESWLAVARKAREMAKESTNGR